MTNPSDGRLTSQATFTGSLSGTDLLFLVSPPVPASAINYKLPVATFTAAIGTLPPGGSLGQILENLGTTNFSAQWTNLSNLILGSTGIFVAGSTTLGVQLASTVGLSVLGVGGQGTAVPAPIGPGAPNQVVIVNAAGTLLAFGPNTPGSLPSSLIREPAGTTSIQLATTDLMVGLDSSVGTVSVALPLCASWVAANPFTVVGLLVRDIIGSASVTTGLNFTTSGGDTFRNGGIQPRIRNPYGAFRFYPTNAQTGWDVG
jgi:hypothetical protein